MNALEEPDRIERIATMDIEQMAQAEGGQGASERTRDGSGSSDEHRALSLLSAHSDEAGDEDETVFDGTVGVRLGVDPPTVPIIQLPNAGQHADSD